MKVLSISAEGDVVWVIYQHPSSRKALISDNEDGTYTVFLPAGVSEEKRKKLALHELEHMRRGDLHSGGNVEEIERSLEK